MYHEKNRIEVTADHIIQYNEITKKNPRKSINRECPVYRLRVERILTRISRVRHNSNMNKGDAAILQKRWVKFNHLLRKIDNLHKEKRAS